MGHGMRVATAVLVCATACGTLETPMPDAGGGGPIAQPSGSGPQPSARDATAGEDSTPPDASGDAGTIPPVAEDGGAQGQAILDAATDLAPTTDASSGAPDAQPAPQDPEGAYQVELYIGGLNHIAIARYDAEAGHCAIVHLTSPSSDQHGPELVVEDGWSLSQGYAFEVSTPDHCGHWNQLPGSFDDRVFTQSARGTVAFADQAPSGLPCQLDIDIILAFEPRDAIPTEVRLVASDLPVSCP